MSRIGYCIAKRYWVAFLRPRQHHCVPKTSPDGDCKCARIRHLDVRTRCGVVWGEAHLSLNVESAWTAVGDDSQVFFHAVGGEAGIAGAPGV